MKQWCPACRDLANGIGVIFEIEFVLGIMESQGKRMAPIWEDDVAIVGVDDKGLESEVNSRSVDWEIKCKIKTAFFETFATLARGCGKDKLGTSRGHREIIGHV